MRKLGLHNFLTLVGIIILLGSPQLEAQTRSIQVTVKTSAGKTLDLYSASYALVVGNGNYTKGWDPLPGALRDVREVAEALRKNGFKVTLKTDLTKDDFNRALGEFVLKHGRYKNNRLLFYYAGHGHTRPMATGEELGYLVMVNAPVPEKDPLGFSLSSVDMQALVTQAKIINAKHVLFLFDSCFSGTVLNLRERATPKSISDNIRHPVRQFITAGRANEPVPDHSVFKQAFLDLLEGRAQEPIPDGYLTGEELGLYLKNTVPEYNQAQHPQYGKIRDPKLDKGDFVFVKMGYSETAPIESEETRAQVNDLQKRLKELEEQLNAKKVSSEKSKPKENLAKLQQENGRSSSSQESIAVDSRPKPAQASIDKSSPPNTKLARIRPEQKERLPQYKSRDTLAIFPWVERRQAAIRRIVFIDSLNEAIDITQIFLPTFSYYDLKNKYDTEVIKDLMGQYPAKDLFTKPTFFSNAEPRIDLISQLGGELEVDAVLIGRIDLDERQGRGRDLFETRYSISIIDIENGENYHLRSREEFGSLYDLGTHYTNVFKKLFKKYRDGKMKNR
jgi:hypothetical protein